MKQKHVVCRHSKRKHHKMACGLCVDQIFNEANTLPCPNTYGPTTNYSSTSDRGQKSVGYHRLFINTPTLILFQLLFQSVITASVSVYVRPIKPAFCQINITSKHTANNDPAQKTQSLSLHDSL